VHIVTQMHPADNHYRNLTLRLPDLVVTQDAIVGQTFENCVLIGPAVVALLGTTSFDSNVFDSPDVEAALWHVPDGQQVIVGAVAFVDCTISHCRFQRVGLAVLPGQREAIYRGFGLQP
jgi:hypothetical protein